MKKKKKNGKSQSKEIILIVLLSTIALILSHFFQDFIYIFTLSFICFFIYTLSFKYKIKTFLRLLSVFLFLHLIIFPLIYVLILKYDSSSFEFDSTIFKNEKENSITNIKEKYNSEKTKHYLESIDLVLNENSPKLNQKLEFLNKGNILITKNYLISKNCNDDFSFNHPVSVVSINISDLNGTLISSVSSNSEGCTFSNSELNVKNYLIERKEKLSKKYLNYQSVYTEIVKNNRIWSYRQILPYSLNIFFTGNITPKSKLTNIVFFVHQIIVFVFLLSILVNQLPLTKNEKSESKN
ncbi:hypothetical protein CSC82_27180 [Rhodobacteraceae bacterium 4F10]|nr:hypothetical protein CSC82_27180 [Rhodobacteraceae bacterium 4F10]